MPISLKSVTKSFTSRESGQSVTVLDAIDLEVPTGKIVALFGPNGCGKTTLLNIVSGVEKPDGGEVSITGDAQHDSLIGYAFQNFRDILLPWESALDNVAFGLRARGVSHAEARERTTVFLDQHNFTFPRDNYSYQLSIGQQQTVALARTLMQNSANLLLDEPFAALDHTARFKMQELVELVVRMNSTAALFISHDIDEALYLCDELVLLRKLPATVLQRFPVPFERPRRHDLLASAEFAFLRREVVATFLHEVER